ncbi:transposase [Aerococcus sp. Group 1]|uniref:transposase n=2 Tax=Lactobacillales TaxID=186826 RepID=UPI0022ABE9D9|nr:transposase [Aerococcus sp. Group 1]
MTFSHLKTYSLKSRSTLFHVEYEPFFQTLERYQEGICEALTYTLSNGPIEGMNNKTKLIKRTGYGYHRFDHLRIRIIMASRLVCNDFQPRPLTFSEAA